MSSSQTPVRGLPVRPSLDSFRKQAKTLVRAVAAEDADAIVRVRVRLPRWTPPLALRQAQLVIAREYGFAGWRDLREEVLKRIGAGLDWAASEAQRAIHDNNTDRLKTLLAEHSELLTWRDDDGHPLLQATTPYAMDVSDPDREAQFCRADCAALLIDAGAVATPSVWDILIRSRAAGMMKLLRDKGVLPQTLVVLAALGDADGLRSSLESAEGRDLPAAEMAFMSACGFGREQAAAMMLERCIALDPGLGAEIDRWGNRAAFVADMIAKCPSLYGSTAPWPAFVMRQLNEAMHANNLVAFTCWFTSQPWLLDDSHLALQVDLIEQTAIYNMEAFLQRLLDHNPAALRASPPPLSKALMHAFDYGNGHLMPLLTPIWPLPDDLPHAAGAGDLGSVRRWFDEKGQPQLGELSRHHPWNVDAVSADLNWGKTTAQQVLDVALAWAVLNRRFAVAEFLIAHSANIDTNWSTHEPASILHECAIHGRYEAAQFLTAHGADPTIRDHRWNATPAGWAEYAAKDETMARILFEAEEQWKSDGKA